jgi:hypothetical protein
LLEEHVGQEKQDPSPAKLQKQVPSLPRTKLDSFQKGKSKKVITTLKLKEV